MKRGDLVEYHDPNHLWGWVDWHGVVLQSIPGTENYQIVYWYNNKTKQTHPAKKLRLINETETR